MSAAQQLCIIGLGQLGGSIAIAAKEANPALHIAGYDIASGHASMLHARGVIDHMHTQMRDAVAQADIVLLACPLSGYEAAAKAIAAHAPSHAIITDIGSVKAPMARLASLCPQHAVVPAHPIAGGERIGPEAARPALFKDKLLVITPLEQTPAEAMERVAQFWEDMGAIIMEMGLTAHDQIYAHVSHLPHAIAFVAGQWMHDAHIRMEPSDDVLQKFLRIGKSGARMWCDVFAENHLAILPPYASFIALLEQFVKELKSGEPCDTPEEQKAMIAKTHLPRILAGALVSAVSLYEQQAGFNVQRFAAGGLRDIAAPAAIDPEAALADMSSHAGFLAELVESILPYFRGLESVIAAQDTDTLMSRLEVMRNSTQMLFQKLQ
jgi:prephenate dehydrogenase